MNNEDFEKTHVHAFYSTCAKDFSITRTKPWPKILDFLCKYDNSSFTNLDCGCGNGRNLRINHTGIFIGFDYSFSLLQQCNELNVKHNTTNDLVRGDCLLLPFIDNSFDLILSIAVLHHFSTFDRRKTFMKEMFRCLKNNGRILIYVWDEQTKYKSKFKQISNKDYFVEFNKSFDRYYYLFDKDELHDFCIECEFIVEEIGIEQESLYAILRKEVIE